MKQYVKQNTHWPHERIREVEVQLQGSGGVYYVDAVAVAEAAEEASEYQSAIAQVVQTNDYSPFGAPLAGRTYKPIDENNKIELVKVTFDSGTDGWVSNGATLGNSQGRLQLLTYNAAAQSAQKTYTNLLTIGKKYRVSFDFVIDGITTASFTINNGSTQVRDKLTTITTKEVTEFTATATNLTLLATLSAGNYGRLAHIDNLVIEEIFETGEGYRFGFNGMEKDDEVYGTGNFIDYGARVRDPRLGPWLSVDPLQQKYPSLSPYNYVGNNPIAFIDPDGKSIKPGKQTDEAVIKEAIAPYENKGLFFVQPVPYVDRQGNKSMILKTFTSNKDFNKALKNSGLSKDEQKTAKAYFNLLKSNDVIEIAVVNANTSRSDNNQSGNAPQTVVATENPNLDKLTKDLQTIKDPIQKMEQLDANLKTGDVTGENFGYFEDRGAQNNPIQGAIVVVNPTTTNDTTLRKDDKKNSNSETIKTMNKAVIAVDDKKVGTQPD